MNEGLCWFWRHQHYNLNKNGYAQSSDGEENELTSVENVENQ